MPREWPKEIAIRQKQKRKKKKRKEIHAWVKIEHLFKLSSGAAYSVSESHTFVFHLVSLYNPAWTV